AARGLIGAYAAADAAPDAEPRDIAVDEVRAGQVLGIGDGKKGGGEDGGGVCLGRIEIVVEVKGVGGDAVHERGPGRGHAAAVADDVGRPVAPGGDHGAHRLGRLVA